MPHFIYIHIDMIHTPTHTHTHTYIYIYIYIYIYNYNIYINIISNRLIGLVGRVFTNGPGDWGSIPGRVIPKT